MADFDQPQFDPSDGEAQDRAETLDETNLTEDGEEIANFDEIPDVYDAVTAEGDEDDEVAEDADDLSIDDDDLDDLDTTNDDERDDEGEDIDLEPLAAHNRTSDNPEDLNMGEQPRSFEPGEQAAADTDTDSDESKKAPPSQLSTERRLDHGLKETFPASDPVSINPGAD
jgi:hypothetical protein